MVSREQLAQVLNNEGRAMPLSKEERVQSIINSLLEAEAPIELHALEGKLYVSEETIRKDLGLLRTKLKSYNLFLKLDSEAISLSGDEVDKRKMRSEILFHEFNKNILSTSAIADAFPSYDVSALKELLLNICNKYRYFINEYTLNSLILDLIIAIDRMHLHKLTRSSDRIFEDLGNEVRALANEIIADIEKLCKVSFNEYEMDELAILLFGYMTRVNYQTLTLDNVEKTVGSKCMTVIRKIKAELNRICLFDMSNEEFMIRFIVHIYNLIRRSGGSYSAKNPLTEHLRATCPSIYEIAVMVAHIIEEETGSHIGRHETASIALHLGSMLETQQSGRLSAIIIYPEFYNLSSKMANQLNEIFHEDLAIKGVATTVEEAKKFEDIDLVISTVLNDDLANTVIISPFLVERDIGAIRAKINQRKHYKQKEYLKSILLSISGSEFFKRNLNFRDEKAAIEYMSEELMKEGYVDEHYVKGVLERESSHSTAYGVVAIPHSGKRTATQTFMYIIINEKAMPWGKNKVNIIFQFAISPNDYGKFYEIFDNLIALLLEPHNARRIIACNTYEEFVDTILNLFKGN
jgi:lichenan operon transcriptional antiterminator